MPYIANPAPADLDYLPPQTTGWGAWAQNERPESDLSALWLKHADNCLMHFHQPDLEAIRISAAVALSHFLLDSPAVWTFIIGVPSSGKTALIINPLNAVHGTHPISDLTPSCFLSGSGTGNNSLLKRTGASKIWLLKDFTTLLQKRHEDRSDVMRALREIWDGKIHKETGSDAKGLGWEGKITAIAACTPELESHWAVGRSLGERFLQVQVRLPDPEGAFLASIYQTGKEKQISDALFQSCGQWINKAYDIWRKENPRYRTGPENLPSLKLPQVDPTPEEIRSRHALYGASWILAEGRRSVPRDFKGDVADVSDPELLARISRSLWTLAIAHGRLFSRTSPLAPDFKAACRLAWDAIPSRRRLILDALPRSGEGISEQDLHKKCKKLYHKVFKNTLEELSLIGLVDHTWKSADAAKFFSLAPEALNRINEMEELFLPVSPSLRRFPERRVS